MSGRHGARYGSRGIRGVHGVSPSASALASAVPVGESRTVITPRPELRSTENHYHEVSRCRSVVAGMGQWCSAMGAGVEQDRQRALFGRIRPRNKQRSISAPRICQNTHTHLGFYGPARMASTAGGGWGDISSVFVWCYWCPVQAAPRRAHNITAAWLGWGGVLNLTFASFFNMGSVSRGGTQIHERRSLDEGCISLNREGGRVGLPHAPRECSYGKILYIWST